MPYEQPTGETSSPESSAERKMRASDFRRHAERFVEAPRDTQDVKILQREIQRILPVQTGKLLCACLDRGLLNLADRPRWYLDQRSCEVLKGNIKLLARCVEDRLQALPKDNPDRPGHERFREMMSEVVDVLFASRANDARKFELPYLVTWFACIHRCLAPKQSEHFRSDWPEYYGWIDFCGPFRLGAVRWRILYPTSDDARENFLASLRASADIQATACTILAELLGDYQPLSVVTVLPREQKQNGETLRQSQSVVGKCTAEKRESGKEAQSLREGYLGLQFDDDHLIVMREGYAERVDVSRSKLSWEILCELNASKNNWLSEGDLKDVWKTAGVAQIPTAGTVTSAISVVRKTLAPLHLNIEWRRNRGYRLVSSEEALSGNQ